MKIKRMAVVCFSILMLTLSGSVSAEEGWGKIQIPGRLGDDVQRHETTQAGYAWCRAYVKVPSRWVTEATKTLWVDSVVLSVERVDGAHEAYVNGVLVGSAGSMPPAYQSGLNVVARHKVPPGLLRKDAWNQLAIRVYHPGKTSGAGLTGRAPVIAGYELDISLDGQWEYRPGDDGAWAQTVFEAGDASTQYEEAVQSYRPTQKAAELFHGAKLAPAEALAALTVSDDLIVEQVLTEPLVAQPLHVSFDAKGRMWVVQFRQYPYPAGLKMLERNKYYRARFDGVSPPPPNHYKGIDQISIHEDSNGDGQFDTHKTFLDDLSMVTSVAHDAEGVWVLMPPYLLFYPDKNGDDVPDGDPEVHLSGFGLEDAHAMVNSMRWGPDGWLYGVQGSNVTARIKAPGNDDPEAIYFEGPGLWRYHPQLKKYEVVSEGGGNAFSLEIDSGGRFLTGHNGGNTRGFHYIPGAYYSKGTDVKFGPPSNPYTFGLLAPMVTEDAIPRFTHAMIKYEGGALPKRFDSTLFCVDPLHHKLVLARIEPNGSSFQTTDLEDVLTSTDTSFRPVAITTGPDGAIYVCDFYEQFIAHGQHYQGQIDPTSGRIYRIRAKTSEHGQPFDLENRSSQELIGLFGHNNKWFRQNARRVLVQRGASAATIQSLKPLLSDLNEGLALEALWTLYGLGAIDADVVERIGQRGNAIVSSWLVRLVGEDQDLVARFGEKLATEPNELPVAEADLRMAAASRHLPLNTALAMLKEIVSRASYTDDPMAPLVSWWAIEARVEESPQAVIDMLSTVANKPLVADYLLPNLMRRFAAAGGQKNLLYCAQLLDRAPTAQIRSGLMGGFDLAMAGKTSVTLPDQLVEVMAKRGVGGSIMLNVRRGDDQAIDEALTLIANPKAKLIDRLQLIATFGQVDEPRSVAVLLKIAASKHDVQVRKAALAALMRYDDPAIAPAVIQGFNAMPHETWAAALNLLASRASSSQMLLEAVDAGGINPGAIEAPVVAKLRLHESSTVKRLTDKLFPPKPGGAQTQAEYARIKAVLESGVGRPYEGKAIYMQSCGACHTLFHHGANIGPNLTAYQRTDLDTMLFSIVDPAAEVREGYNMRMVTTTDGRVLSGFLVDQDNSTLSLRGLDGQDVTLGREQIKTDTGLPGSLMPAGLLSALNDEQLRDLFAYLMSAQPMTK